MESIAALVLCAVAAFIFLFRGKGKSAKPKGIKTQQRRDARYDATIAWMNSWGSKQGSASPYAPIRNAGMSEKEQMWCAEQQRDQIAVEQARADAAARARQVQADAMARARSGR